MLANTRHMIVPAMLDGLVLAAFAGAMLTTGGATLDAAALALLFFGGTMVAVAGSVIVAWTVGDAHPSHHVMAILLGSLTTSLALLLGCMTTGTLAAKVFLAWRSWQYDMANVHCAVIRSSLPRLRINARFGQKRTRSTCLQGN